MEKITVITRNQIIIGMIKEQDNTEQAPGARCNGTISPCAVGDDVHVMFNVINVVDRNGQK